MKILLTNDDGYSSFLIQDMYDFLPTLLPESDILVFAPHKNRSAISSAITIDPIMNMTEIKEGVFSVEGYPVDCVKVATMVKGNFDLIISGPNIGANLGDDIIYSGTVSAAREAALLGIPSIAFSIIDDVESIDNLDLDQWHIFLKSWLPILIDVAKEHIKSVVNINVPIPISLNLYEVPLSKRYYNNSYSVSFLSQLDTSKNFPKQYVIKNDFKINDDRVQENTDWYVSMQGHSVMNIIPSIPLSIKSNIDINNQGIHREKL